MAGLHYPTDDGKESKMRNTDNKESLTKNTMREDICHYIQKQIDKGIYKPGDRIVETKLAKELKVSQAPVREAFLELSMMGLLEVKPYSGTFVSRTTSEDILDAYLSRAVIEENAVEKATRNITEEDIEDLHQIIDEMQAIGDAQDYETFMDLDTEFHEKILEISRSKSFFKIWKMLRLGEWTYYALEATPKSLQEITDEHEAILHQMEKGLEHGASAQMYIHIQSYADTLRDYFTGHYEKDELLDPNK